MAADGGDGAVGACVVAAIGDLEEGVDAAGDGEVGDWRLKEGVAGGGDEDGGGRWRGRRGRRGLKNRADRTGGDRLRTVGS